MRHYSLRTERAYSDWVRRYIRYNGMRHPSQMGGAQVAAFLSSLANGRRVSASTLLLGHKDVSTTMIYTHVLNRGGRGVVSPLDR